MKKIKLLIALLIACLSSLIVDAQSLCNALVTPDNHTIIVQASNAPTLDNAPLPIGSHILVMYDSLGLLKCAGAVTWNGVNTAITAYGDDSSTPEKDGFAAGERFKFKIELANGTVINNVNDSYLSGMFFTHDSTFAVNGISALGTLNATSCTLSSTFMATDISCNGANNGSIDITPIGGNGTLTYQWNNGATTQDLVGLSPGNYTCTINDGTCTFTTPSITISEPISLSATFNVTNVSTVGANDGAIDLAPLGGIAPYSFLWSNTDTTEDVNNLLAGVYTCTISDANGCSFLTPPITVSVPVPLAVNSAVNDVNCFGGIDGSISLTVTGGTSPYSYQWNTGAITKDLNNLSANTYSCTVTDILGASITTSVTVSEPQVLATSLTYIDESSVSACDGLATITTTGGTAPYTYTWSAATVGNVNTATGLCSGTYTVTVTDVNGCTALENFTINVVGTVFTFEMGQVIATAGSTVSIPVKVTNCNNVVTMQMSMHYDSTIITNVTPSNFGLTGMGFANFGTPTNGIITFSWDDLTLLGTTLVDGTIIFMLDMTIASTATAGTISPISITGNPLQMEVVDNNFNIIPSTKIDGSISIALQLSGQVLTESGQGIKNVQMDLSGGMTTQQMTLADGTYDFSSIAANQNYSLCPQKDIAANNGVTTLDILFMRLHILGTTLLSTPYKIIAADVDNSGNVSTLDILLTRQVILGIAPSFLNNTAWRFIPSAYTFPDPTDPFFTTFPECIDFNNLGMTAINQDFIGIKVGDVNETANPLADANTAQSTTHNELKLQIKDRVFQANETVIVSFEAKDFTDITGYQFTLEFDEDKLTFENIETHKTALADLSATNFGLSKTEDGIITTSWIDQSIEGVTLKDGQDVFTLKFKAKQGGKLSEVLDINASEILSEAYDLTLTSIGIDEEFKMLTSTQSTPNPMTELHQNQPNPFLKTTTIGLTLPKMLDSQLIIYDSVGRVVKVYDNAFQIGYHEIEITDIETSGVYYYELRTPTQSVIKKMIKY